MNPVLLYGLYAAVGKLFIFVAQSAGPFEAVWNLLESRYPKFQEFHECGWCIGCYIYPILAYLMQLNILDDLTYNMMGYIITGVVTSFLVQALHFGLKYWFGWGEI